MKTATKRMGSKIGDQIVARRKQRFTPATFLVLWLLCFCLAPVVNAGIEIEDAIVKIFVTKSQPDYYHPWNMNGAIQVTGSGAVIAGNRLLSNAHVVSDHTFVQVRRVGDPRRFQAHVEWVSTAADLAVLTVDDPEFFKGIKPLAFGKLPALNAEVTVYGFPVGGDTLSLTKGVLSRVEHQFYTHGTSWLLAGQIDAAINPGNSGGPVMANGQLVGVVMQHQGNADNIGYMVPVNVIRHFLRDIEDGRLDGIPALGIQSQPLENHALKRRFGLKPHQTGILITHVNVGAAAAGILRAGDVLLSIDDQKIADDGTVEFRPRQYTCSGYVVQERQIGETVRVGVLRDGAEKMVPVKLTQTVRATDLISHEQYDVLPSYYIYGGAVFTPLSMNLLKCWGENWFHSAPKDLVAMLLRNRRDRIDQEIVLLIEFLPANVNQGYHGISHLIVETVNGRKIDNLRDLIAQIEAETDSKYVELKSSSGRLIVLDRREAAETHAAILDAYRIRADRSPDMLPDAVAAEGL